MFKKFFSILMCLGIALLISSYSFSQDKPVGTEDKKTEDMAGDVKIGDKDEMKDTKAADSSQVSALEAKTYTDGVSVFANSKVLFKLSTKDNVMTDKIEYKINDGALLVYEQPFEIMDEGKHLITYFGTDKLGNKEDEKIFRITIDNTPPTISVITDKPVLKIQDKLYASKAINFTVKADDPVAGLDAVQYKINENEYVDYIAPFNISNDGEVEMKIKASDNVTNTSEMFSLKVVNDTDGMKSEIKDSSVKLFIDNNAPTIEIKADKEFVENKQKKIASNDFKYSVTATDQESGIKSILIRLDSKGDFVPYQNEFTFTTNGEHLIEAMAVDKMGNVSKTAVLSVFVDVIPPESTIETVTEKKEESKDTVKEGDMKTDDATKDADKTPDTKTP